MLTVSHIKMELSCNKIKAKFKVPYFVPDEISLIENDGYDVLEKKGALKFFEGKNYENIFNHLRSGGAYYLEEWTVLNISAVTYYAPAYFCYLLLTLESEEPDEEFIFFLVGALYQIIYIYKGSPFNYEQTEIINELVNLSVEASKYPDKFEYYSEDIVKSGKEYFDELKKHER